MVFIDRIRSQYSRVGWALVTLMVAPHLVTVVIARIISLFLKPGSGSLDSRINAFVPLLIGVLPIYAIGLPLALMVFRTAPTLKVRHFSLSPRMFFGVLCACAPIAIVGNIIGGLLAQVITGGQAQNPIEQLAVKTNLLAFTAVAVIFAPIIEEWIFRKCIIDRLRCYGEKSAMLMSALAFALFHTNLFQFFYTFGLGLLLAYVYIRTSRLRYSVLIHAIFNFFGGAIPVIIRLLIGNLVYQLSNNSSDVSKLLDNMSPAQVAGLVIAFFYLIIMLIMFIVGIITIVRLIRHREWYRTPEQLPGAVNAKVIISSPGLVVFTIIAIGLTILSLYAQ